MRKTKLIKSYTVIPNDINRKILMFLDKKTADQVAKDIGGQVFEEQVPKHIFDRNQINQAMGRYFL